MPTNVTAQYRAAEAAYRAAKTIDERRSSLEEMLATVPKHKGTEKLQADIKRRLARLRQEGERRPPHKGHSVHVEPEGAAQVVLLAPPNAGKSSLLPVLTHARPTIVDYPFATTKPQPGMMRFEDVQIQLVDLPPIAPEHMDPWLPNVAQTSDAAILVADPSDPDTLSGIELIRERMAAVHLPLVGELPDDADARDMPLPTLLVLAKVDLVGPGDLEVLEELYGPLTVAVLAPPHYAKDLGKKGTTSDITFYNMKKGDATVTLIEPTRYPEKLSSLFYTVSLADRIIMVVDEINSSFGESVLMLQCAGKSSGFLILKNYITIDQIAPLIRGTVIEHYEVMDEDIVGLREKILENAIKLTAHHKAKPTGSNGAVPIDNHFNVKGVGIVVLGCVSRRCLEPEKRAAGRMRPALGQTHRRCRARDHAAFSCPLGIIDPERGPFRFADTPIAQKTVEVTHPVTIEAAEFRFARPFTGLEVVKEAGTLIGWDGEREVRTPYDDCVLVMPSKRLYRGQTAVRMGRFVAMH